MKLAPLLGWCVISTAVVFGADAQPADAPERPPAESPTPAGRIGLGAVVETLDRDGVARLEPLGIELRDVGFELDGKRVEAVSCVPIGEGEAGGEGPRPAMLLIPGYSRTARDYVPLLVRLGKMGVVAMAVTQPGFGRSDGPADFVGPGTLAAVEAAFERLGATPGVDPARVGVFGYSRGAMAASLLATRRDDLACAIFGAGIYDLEALYPEIQLEGIRENVDLETGGAGAEALRERSSIHAMDQLACPVLILHGARDINTPASQARMLADRLDELDKDCELRIYDDRDHDVGRDNLNEAMASFLDRTILSESGE